MPRRNHPPETRETRPTGLALFATIVLPIQLPGCDAVVLRGAEPSPDRVTLPALRPATGSATDPFARPGTKAVVVSVLSFKCPSPGTTSSRCPGRRRVRVEGRDGRRRGAERGAR